MISDAPATEDYVSVGSEAPMNCDKCLETLSEYQAGLLGENDSVYIRKHLEICVGCLDVFKDLDSIVKTALLMREENGNGIAYPDESALWARLSIDKGIVH